MQCRPPLTKRQMMFSFTSFARAMRERGNNHLVAVDNSMVGVSLSRSLEEEMVACSCSQGSDLARIVDPVFVANADGRRPGTAGLDDDTDMIASVDVVEVSFEGHNFCAILIEDGLDTSDSHRSARLRVAGTVDWSAYATAQRLSTRALCDRGGTWGCE